jgi:hypothetical protein
MFDVGPLAFSPRFKTPTAVASSNSNAAGGHPAVSSGKPGQHNKSYDKGVGTVTAFVVAMAAWFIAAPARAHFQELIPSADIVSRTSGETIVLDVVFTHPFEGGSVMDMGTPVQFGVLVEGQKQDLRSSLTPRPVAGKNAYQARFTPRAPGDYVFYIEPAPYWEPAEKKMIVHYAKVVVDAFGAERGWDAMVGLPVEIEPLVRPFGLWTGADVGANRRHEVASEGRSPWRISSTGLLARPSSWLAPRSPSSASLSVFAASRANGCPTAA